MNKWSFVAIANKLVEEAKNELPSFSDSFYLSYSSIFAAVKTGGSVETSCSYNVLDEALECFVLVSGKNNAETFYYLLYYIDKNGIPHKEGYIDGKLSVRLNISRGWGKLNTFNLCYDDCVLVKTEWSPVDGCEKAFREILNYYIVIKECRTKKEAELNVEMMKLKSELILTKRINDFTYEYISKENRFYRELLDEIKNLIQQKEKL